MEMQFKATSSGKGSGNSVLLEKEYMDSVKKNITEMQPLHITLGLLK